MAEHTLPGLGLTGDFTDGQDNWGGGMNANLARLTIAVNTSVLGAVANAGALPGSPADGAMYLQSNNGHIRAWDAAAAAWSDTTPKAGWRLFRQDTLDFMAYIDGVWVAEDSGPSLPEGGTAGQVLAKASDDDGDAEWVDPEAASFPAGTTGQVLTKTPSGVAFADLDALPPGGGEGDILVYGPDGPEWGAASAADGGVWAVVDPANGAILAGAGCAVQQDTSSRFNITFNEPRESADYGVTFGGTSGAGGTLPYVVDGSQTVNGFSVICYNNGGGEAAPYRLIFELVGGGAEAGGVSLPDGGTTGQVLAKASDADGDAEWIDPPEGGGTQLYRFGSFFLATPGASEVLMMHAVTDAFTLPINLAGSVWKTGTNPSGNTVFSLRRNGAEIATITVAANGTATFANAAAVNIAAGDLLTLLGPAAANGIASTAFTFRGTI